MTRPRSLARRGSATQVPWRRLAAHAALLLALLVPTVACFAPQTVTIGFTRPVELNPRLRTDRKALTPEQLGAAALAGTYRDGKDSTNCDNGPSGCEVIAPVTPAQLGQDALEKVMQSGCLWLGSDSGGQAEAIAANWEVVVDVRREGMHLSCESPTRFGLCRLRNPETGEPIAFQPLDRAFQACMQADPPAIEQVAVDFAGLSGSLPLTGQGDGGPLWIAEDLYTATTPLVAEYAARATADPYRRCPGTADAPQAFSGGTSYPAFLSGRGCSASSASVSACGLGCIGHPLTGDQTLRLRDTSNGGTRPLGPNLMKVERSASIARAMTSAGTSTLRAWRTGVSVGNDRWHENFSPNLTVDSVRVFVPGPNDNLSSDDSAPSLATNPNLNAPGITVRGSYLKPDNRRKTFSFDCPGIQTAHGWEFLLGAGHACTGEQADVAPQDLTPTYAQNHLNVAAFPLDDPLRWEVVLNNANAPAVWIEFRLRAKVLASGIVVTPAGLVAGRVVVGQRETGWLELTNVGGSMVRLTTATLGGSHPADFSYRIVGAQAPVPLPIAITMTRGKRVVRAIELAGKDRPSDRVPAPTVGRTHLRLVHPDRDGTTLTAYGNTLDYRGDVAFHRDGLRPVPYTYPAGSVPLDVLDAYTSATLPIDLAPAQTLRVAVTAQPAIPDRRSAQLRFEGHPLGNPNERLVAIAALQVEGETGADPVLVPDLRYWHRVGRGGESRSLLLINNGSRATSRRPIRFASGRNFSLVSVNAANQSVGAGESELVTVRFVPTCPGPDLPVYDTLIIDTDQGPREARLHATPAC